MGDIYLVIPITHSTYFNHPPGYNSNHYSYKVNEKGKPQQVKSTTDQHILTQLIQNKKANMLSQGDKLTLLVTSNFHSTWQTYIVYRVSTSSSQLTL